MNRVLQLLLLGATVAGAFRIPVHRHHKGKPMTGMMFTAGDHSANATDLQVEGDWKTDGSYYIVVNIGKQEFALFLDTGSSDIGVAAEGCHGCTKKFHHPYSPSDTATPLYCDWCDAHKDLSDNTHLACKKRPGVRKHQCTMITGYADHSGFSAALYEDTLTLVGLDKSLPVPTVIGAIYEAKFPNGKAVDGIIGLADQIESVTGAPNFIDNLVAQGTIDNVFSMCLNDDGGHIYLGLDHKPTGNEMAVMSQPKSVARRQLSERTFEQGLYGFGDTVQWTPRVPGVGFYAVEVTDVLVNGKKLHVKPSVWNNGSTIIDSGTTDSALPASGLKAIKNAFYDICSNKTTCLKGTCNCDTHKPLTKGIWESRCVQMSPDDIAQYPPIDFVMKDGVHLTITPQMYLKNSAIFCDKGAYTITFSKGADNDGTILGANVMQGYFVVHDRRPPGRMGFAPIGKRGCPN